MRVLAFITIFLSVCTALITAGTAAPHSTYTKSMPKEVPGTISDSIAACNEVQRSGKFPVNCIVTYVQGHPTLAVEFSDERSMNAYLGAFAEYVADPFCEAANKEHKEAYFVVALKYPRVGSVSSCETRELSEWVSVDSQ